MCQLLPTYMQLISRPRLQLAASSQLEAPLICTSEALIPLGREACKSGGMYMEPRAAHWESCAVSGEQRTTHQPSIYTSAAGEN